MIVNSFNLKALYVAFNAAFQTGLGMAPSNFQQIATVVPSTTKSNEYGWLGKFPKMREWIGDRVINGMATHGYAIRNKPFEVTIGVDRDDVDDDNVGIYTSVFQDLGMSAQEQPDELTFGLLKAGISTTCYDGQYFFDTDHPVLAEDGITAVSQSNYDANGGSGTPWYLLDTTRPLKPLIFQERKKPQFVAMDNPNDEAVFMNKEFRYGVDSRCNAGFGFWQLAYCSRKELTAENVQAAYTAMTSRLGDNGRTLNIRPSLLVVPPTLKFKAAEILTANQIAGTDNIMKGLVKVLDDARLQ